MNIVTIAWKSLRERALASGLTAVCVALGVMLMVTVLVIHGVINEAFSLRSVSYDLVVGPSKGSAEQLVLSAIYRISAPAENLPFKYYKQLKELPTVELAIPVALGDTTEKGNFPICGTIPEYFSVPVLQSRSAGQPPTPFRVAAPGRFMEEPFDAVIGAKVARENGWGIGTELKLVHGGAEGHVHDEKFTVVGVLQASGTPNDKTVFVHLDGFYQIQGHDKPVDEAIRKDREFFDLPKLSDAELAAEVEKFNAKYGHDHHHHDHDHDHGHSHAHFHDIPEIQKEVTSILLKMKRPQAAILLAGELKKGSKASAANPARVMIDLTTNLVGNVSLLLFVLTSLIVVVSGVSIFVSIYNSMSSRMREIAVLRALGAQRETVLKLILAESTILCLGGGLVGALLGHALVMASAPIVEARSGMVINPFRFELIELALFPALFVLGICVGLLPGVTAYRTNVAEQLSS